MSTSNTITEFFAAYPKRTLDEGEMLLAAGDTPEGIYFIESGQIRQYDIADNGSNIVVNILREDAHFPMSYAIHAEQNMWYFDAVTQTTIRTAPATEVLAFLRSDMDAMYAYLERLCSGASGQQRRMAHLMGGSAETRTIFELVTEAKRFGEEENGVISLTTTDTELAAKAGLSREALNRELSKLVKEGLVIHSYGSIKISDIGKLQARLGSDI